MKAYDPAFPHPWQENGNGQVITNGSSGMTMRQYYKAAAIKGITANQYFFGATYQGTPEGALDFAVHLADLAIAEDAEFEAKKP